MATVSAFAVDALSDTTIRVRTPLTIL
jgi:hypothetical protein